MIVEGRMKRWALQFLSGGRANSHNRTHQNLTENPNALASLNDEIEQWATPFLVEAGSHVLDIGAHYGRSTKRFAELAGPTGVVHAIEPIPQTAQLLKANLRRLRLQNVTVYNVAISDGDCLLPMEVPSFPSGGENFADARVVSNCELESRRVDCVARSLDSLFGHHRDLSFVKCDTAGHELAILRGAGEILRKAKPAWMLTLSGRPDDPTDPDREVMAIMSDAGYQAYRIEGRKARRRQPGDPSGLCLFLTTRHLRRIPTAA